MTGIIVRKRRRWFWTRMFAWLARWFGNAAIKDYQARLKDLEIERECSREKYERLHALYEQRQNHCEALEGIGLTTQADGSWLVKPLTLFHRMTDEDLRDVRRALGQVEMRRKERRLVVTAEKAEPADA